jgi:hypothetical protein
MTQSQNEINQFISALYYKRPDQLGDDVEIDYQFFGRKILMNEEYILITDPYADLNFKYPISDRRNVGAVVLVNLVTSESRVILPPVLSADTRFGYDIAMSGDYFVVSATGRNQISNSANESEGVAWLYKFSDPNFVLEIGRGITNNVSQGWEFGTSVAIEGNLILVSEPIYQNSVGAVHAYKLLSNGNEIVKLMTLQDSSFKLNSAIPDMFGGGSISVSDEYISIYSWNAGDNSDYSLSDLQAGGRAGVILYKYELNETLRIEEMKRYFDNSMGTYGYYNEIVDNKLVMIGRPLNAPNTYYVEVVNIYNSDIIYRDTILTDTGNYPGGLPHYRNDQLIVARMLGPAASTNSIVTIYENDQAKGTVRYIFSTPDGLVEERVIGLYYELSAGLGPISLERYETNILNWTRASELGQQLNNPFTNELYTLEILGEFIPKETGQYRFSLNNDDYASLSIGDMLLFDKTVRKGMISTGNDVASVNLIAGVKYDFRLFLSELGGPEGLSLLWQRPSDLESNRYYFYPDELMD